MIVNKKNNISSETEYKITRFNFKNKKLDKCGKFYKNKFKLNFNY